MKLKHFNKKIYKKTDKDNSIEIENIGNTIPINFFDNTTYKISFENILNSLPEPIKYILQNGHEPKSIKYSGDIITITTSGKFIIRVKISTIDNNKIECNIYDKKNKLTLLNTFKCKH